MTPSTDAAAPAAEPDAPAPAAAREFDPHVGLIATPLRSLLRRDPVSVSPATSIREAALLMREQRVSSLLVVERGHLFGIVTDRDLRDRAVAAGLSSSEPIIEIATVAPLTIDVHAMAFDALLLMARQNIRHVPVTDGSRLVGMVTATDLMERHSNSAVFLCGEIYAQNEVEGLQRTSTRIRHLQRDLVAADASAYATGHVITAVTDALTTRLLQLGEARFGPAPVDYAWVAAGSQARSEQTAKSDQDNCLILSDAYDDAAHGAYFKSLADFVCAGLDACGYVFCPGEMMAKTDTWRQPLQRWKQYFRRWIDEPDPSALMLTCVFFDLRAVYGNGSLLELLRADVLQRTRGNGFFLTHMVGNALSHQPPLGLFGRIAAARSGEHRGAVDLKHNGIVPIVDLARVYALAGGHAAVNTHDRLEAAALGNEVSPQSARDLRDTLEYLAVTRVRHQARQMQAGETADSYVALEELSNFERTQLKDAFAVVQTLQSVMEQRYRAGRF